MGLTLLYEITQRNVMYVLVKTLTPDSKTGVSGKQMLLEMNGLNMRQRGRGNMK